MLSWQWSIPLISASWQNVELIQLQSPRRAASPPSVGLRWPTAPTRNKQVRLNWGWAIETRISKHVFLLLLLLLLWWWVVPGSYTLMLDVLGIHSVTRSLMGGCRYLMWRFIPTGKTTYSPSHYTGCSRGIFTMDKSCNSTINQPTDYFLHCYSSIPHLCQLVVAIPGWHGGHVFHGTHVSSELQTCNLVPSRWLGSGRYQNMLWRITFRRIQYWTINNLYSINIEYNI